jgi:hypothetical protein
LFGISTATDAAGPTVVNAALVDSGSGDGMDGGVPASLPSGALPEDHDPVGAQAPSGDTATVFVRGTSLDVHKDSVVLSRAHGGRVLGSHTVADGVRPPPGGLAIAATPNGWLVVFVSPPPANDAGLYGVWLSAEGKPLRQRQLAKGVARHPKLATSPATGANASEVTIGFAKPDGIGLVRVSADPNAAPWLLGNVVTLHGDGDDQASDQASDLAFGQASGQAPATVEPLALLALGSQDPFGERVAIGERVETVLGASGQSEWSARVVIAAADGSSELDTHLPIGNGQGPPAGMRLSVGPNAPRGSFGIVCNEAPASQSTSQPTTTAAANEPNAGASRALSLSAEPGSMVLASDGASAVWAAYRSSADRHLHLARITAPITAPITTTAAAAAKVTKDVSLDANEARAQTVAPLAVGAAVAWIAADQSLQIAVVGNDGRQRWIESPAGPVTAGCVAVTDEGIDAAFSTPAGLAATVALPLSGEVVSVPQALPAAFDGCALAQTDVGLLLVYRTENGPGDGPNVLHAIALDPSGVPLTAPSDLPTALSPRRLSLARLAPGRMALAFTTDDPKVVGALVTDDRGQPIASPPSCLAALRVSAPLDGMGLLSFDPSTGNADGPWLVYATEKEYVERRLCDAVASGRTAAPASQGSK